MKAALKFLMVIALMTVLWTMLWSIALTHKVYDCTDEIGFDYLRPGQWVHGSIEYVEQIDPNRGMEQADTIKRGWTIDYLWGIWVGMTAMSVALGILFARRGWGVLTQTTKAR